MSLILDALRKSEAERRRGQVPDLRAELPPIIHATAAPRRRWPLWFAGSAALLAATALAWSQWASRQPAPMSVSMSTRTTVSAPVVEPIATHRAPEPAPAPIAVTAQPAPSRAPTTAPIQAAEPAAPARDEPRLAAEPAQPASLPAPAPAPPPSPPAPATNETPGPAPVPAQASLAARMSPPASDPVRLGDLSPGEREQLPALKISMHMWGPTPTQRFAIIDGTRVGQGDRVGDAVVEEIAADGVVLNWHGRRVSLPLR